VEDNFTVSQKMHLTKSWGLKSRQALDFNKRELEHRSITEVYAYVTENMCLISKQ